MQMKLEIYIKKYIENTKSKNNRKILVLMLKNWKLYKWNSEDSNKVI